MLRCQAKTGNANRHDRRQDFLDGFFNMGGYAAFVWPSYAVTALVMVILLVTSLNRLRRLQQRLRDVEQTGRSRRTARPNAAESKV